MIEIAGITCSGKSTVIGKLTGKGTGLIDSEMWLNSYYKKKFEAMGPFAGLHRDRKARACYLFLMHARNYFQYRKFYSLCLMQIMEGEGRFRASRSVFFKFGKYLVLKSAAEKDIVIDEGHVQALFALFVRDRDLSSNSLVLLERMLALMPLPDHLILGPALTDTELTKRLLSRGHHRVTGMRHRYSRIEKGYIPTEYERVSAKNFIRRSRIVYDAIIEGLSDRIPIRILDDYADINSSISELRQRKSHFSIKSV